MNLEDTLFVKAQKQAMLDRQRMVDSPSQFHPQPCHCIGPQNGQPACPCAMRGMIIRNGRYIKPEQDMGPVK